ncbi:MAG: carbamoyltransferase HypF [Pyrinomonadaceae bacterium]
MIRVQIRVQGIVQGVGFRPFVFSLAAKHSIRGRVLNNTIGVLIDVEGEQPLIQQFIAGIKSNSPTLSRIESIHVSENLEPLNYSDFRITESTADGEHLTPISPDVATCEDCLRELFDPKDRRYRYPFINCTACGPRFTIIEGVPYDRARTTMRDFKMCEMCRAEYENPCDRRFHAEPTACPACGPQVLLADTAGCEMAANPSDVTDPVARARLLLKSGKIVAIKGIGGFHVAADALNNDAVERLRQKKYREDKPFALMANSISLIKEYCVVSKTEAQLLSSARRPVVLLEKRSTAIIPQAVAPRVNTLGFMLPYSPLHCLLLENLDRPVVLTSGNISDEPISYENDDALERLNRIADHFLLHDRRIYIRSDDSVTRVVEGKEIILRRSRGYAPAPVNTSFTFAQQILACGAELKNTFCLTRNSYAFVSHHIGDLENLETLRSFKEGIEHFKNLFHLQPEVVAYDLHPEYLSMKYALALDDITIKVGVQHHHAHVASCMADNEIDGKVIGIAMDGLGFGTDGKLWGGEFFVADFLKAERIVHLDYVPMPGGAKAVREPWRMAAVYLHRAFGDDFLNLKIPFVENLDRRAWATMRRMIAKNTNSPETSSMGRLFDAVSSLLTLRDVVNYEGQAAIELEGMAALDCTERYKYEIVGNESTIKVEGMIRQVVEDLLADVPPPIVSAKFHLGVANLIATVARRIRDKRGLNRVVLSGGIFQNMLLLRQTCGLLKSADFQIFTHSHVPTNDGGISLGQAAIANARIIAGKV